MFSSARSSNQAVKGFGTGYTATSYSGLEVKGFGPGNTITGVSYAVSVLNTGYPEALRSSNICVRNFSREAPEIELPTCHSLSMRECPVRTVSPRCSWIFCVQSYSYPPLLVGLISFG